MSRKKSILIIDDEKDFCYFVKKNLELVSDYKVLIATGGGKGMWYAYWHRPDLILLDIIMPGVDGFALLRKLKEDKRTMSIPVIMLTARNDVECKTQAANLYSEDYIAKPVEIEALVSSIENVLAKHMK
ncbi:MAG: response regulator [Candidatus Omnitrophica bacterium]|nr:response regulator [Candidatus Omnitrophota bacterium]